MFDVGDTLKVFLKDAFLLLTSIQRDHANIGTRTGLPSNTPLR